MQESARTFLCHKDVMVSPINFDELQRDESISGSRRCVALRAEVPTCSSAIKYWNWRRNLIAQGNELVGYVTLV